MCKKHSKQINKPVVSRGFLPPPPPPYFMKTPYIAYPSTFFKKFSLVEVIYQLIRCSKTKFFLRNTNNTDETHTPNT